MNFGLAEPVCCAHEGRRSRMGKVVSVILPNFVHGLLSLYLTFDEVSSNSIEFNREISARDDNVRCVTELNCFLGGAIFL